MSVLKIKQNGEWVAVGVGVEGKTPQKGVDYWTESDKVELVNEIISKLPIYEGEVETV